MWLLLHGFTGSPQSWNPVIKLAELDSACVPSLFGHAEGWESRAVDSFEAEVMRLLSLVAGAERPRLLCGYSLGARVALGLLSRAPNLFDAAVLIGANPGLSEESARSERREIDARRARRLREEGLSGFLTAWESLPLFATQSELPEAVLAEQRRIRLSQDPEGLARSLEVLGLAEMPDYGRVMASLDTPITLMTGALDFRYSELARELAQDNAHIEAQRVEGVGHNVLLEAPSVLASTLKRVEKMVQP